MKLFTKLFVSTSAFLPLFVYAAEVPFSSAGDVTRVIQKVADFMASLILALSVIVILYAGFKYLTAGGSEDEISEAHKMITWAIVGIIVALVAFSIPDLIKAIL